MPIETAANIFPAKSSVNFKVFVDKKQPVEKLSNFTLAVLRLYLGDVSGYLSVKMHPRFMRQAYDVLHNRYFFALSLFGIEKKLAFSSF